MIVLAVTVTVTTLLAVTVTMSVVRMVNGRVLGCRREQITFKLVVQGKN